MRRSPTVLFLALICIPTTLPTATSATRPRDASEKPGYHAERDRGFPILFHANNHLQSGEQAPGQRGGIFDEAEQSSAQVRSKDQDQQKSKTKVPQVSRQAIRIFLDRIEVAGRIDKPQAIFIIPGRSPEVEDIRIDRTFFKEIFRKVEMPTGSRKKTKEIVRKEYILW